MKKKNQPYILVTVLVLLLGSVAFFNLMGQGSPKDAHDHEAEQEEALAGQSTSVSANTKEAMEQRASEAINKKSGNGLKVADSKSVPKTPMVQNPATWTYKPTPNDNATSSQWYQKNTGRK